MFLTQFQGKQYMSKKRRISNIQQRGMALLEVLVAMLIFALAILPLVRLQVMSMDATKAGYFKTETAAAAQSVMDYLMNDVGAVFDGKWDNIVVSSGQNCSSLSNAEEKIACKILNGGSETEDKIIHAPGNAVLCVYGKRPSYTPTSGAKKNHDQYLISIRAIWYSGKRQDSENGHNYYNADLTGADCGSNYDAPMSSSLTQNENIDSIEINMAY